MKSKRTISKIERQAKELNFPREDAAMHMFTSLLREAVYENCGYNIADTLRYELYKQQYYVIVEASGIPLVLEHERAENDDFNMDLSKTVWIDPHAPIAPQIENIMEVQAHLRQAHITLSLLLELNRAGKKMK